MRNYRKPHRIKKRKSIFKNRFFWLFFLIFVFLLATLYFIFLSHFFQIREVKIYGTEKVSSEEMKKFTFSKLEKKLGPFYSKNIFLLNCRQLSEEILANFPKVSKTYIQKKLPNLLILRVDERKPVAVFVTQNEKFFLDQTGIIFEKAEDNNDLLHIKSEVIPTVLELGKKALTKEQLSLILDLKFKLKKDFDIEIIETFIIAEERLNFKTLEGWFLFFTLSDIEEQLAKLKIVLEKEIPKEKRKSLEYIDLRFDEQVYYK